MWWKLYSAFVYPAPGWSPCHSYFSCMDHKIFPILLFSWVFFLFVSFEEKWWLKLNFCRLYASLTASFRPSDPFSISPPPLSDCMNSYPLFCQGPGAPETSFCFQQTEQLFFTNLFFVNWLIGETLLLSNLLCGVLPACPSSLSDGSETSSYCGFLLRPVLQVLTCCCWGLMLPPLCLITFNVLCRKDIFIFM